MIEKSKALEKLYHDYSHLLLGGKKIRCPYWSNKQRILLTGPFKGKGTPIQITRATIEVAQKHNLDLNKISSDGIRRFMERYRLGVDCSGFVYHLADALDKEKGRKGIFDFIKGVKGKGVRKVNAFCLTNNYNSVEIKTLKQIQIGDLVRLQGGKHLAIVIRIERNPSGLPNKVVYAHSAKSTAITGVHSCHFIVLDPSKSLESQKFFEETNKGLNYFNQKFQPEKGDGLRRLKIWI